MKDENEEISESTQPGEGEKDTRHIATTLWTLLEGSINGEDSEVKF